MAVTDGGPALVMMAAGRGSRFGGLKQLTPVGPGGEAIMEYSLHDALAAGFGKIVLVVRRQTEAEFRRKFVDRISERAYIELVHQELEVALDGRPIPPDREKPWGTGHAVLTSRPVVDRPFAVLNADDFYGPSAIAAMAEFLQSTTDSLPMDGAMVGYRLRNTLSDHGTVSRGLCQADGFLQHVVEQHGIRREGDGGAVTESDGSQRLIAGDQTVSMNLWGFPARFLDHVQTMFHQFVDSHPPAAKEFELPTPIARLIDAGTLRVRILPTDEQWCGLTYQEDREVVQTRLARLIDQGVYPQRLWGE